MFGYGKKLDEIHNCMRGMTGDLGRSLTDIRQTLMHLQREAEAKKLELDRVRGAKEHAEANLVEVRRELSQVKEELEGFRTQIENLNWIRPPYRRDPARSMPNGSAIHRDD